MTERINISEGQAEQRLQAVSDLVDIAGRLHASSVIIPGGSRLEDLRLTDAARDSGIIDRIILVGKKDQVHRAVAESGMDIAPQDIVAVDSDEAVAQATVDRIRRGDADIVLKGDISTPILNRAMLPLAVRPTVSLVSIFDAAPIAKGRPVILTDAGVTTVCNLGRMIDLIHNAVDVARVVMNIGRPRVAVLSANEKQIPSLPSTWMGLALAQRTWEHAVVCGPLSFDLATSAQSVAVKGMPDVPHAQEVAGQADILVCPGIDAANILYKALTAMTRYGQASIAGITVGFPIPYIILSRADALETRLDSIALCSVYAQKNAAAKRDTASTRAVPTPALARILAVHLKDHAAHLAVYEGSHCTHDFSVSLQPDAVQTVREAIQAHGVGPWDAVCTGVGGTDLPRDDALFDPVSLIDEAPQDTNSEPARQLTRTLNRQNQATGLIVRCTEQRLALRACVRRAAQALGTRPDQMHLVVSHLGPQGLVAAIRACSIVHCKPVWPCPVPAVQRDHAPLPAETPNDVNGLYNRIQAQGWSQIAQDIQTGDTTLQRQVEGLVMQMAQEISGAFMALDCIVETIVLAGEWMQSPLLRNALRKRVGRLAPVQVYHGSMVMEGLAGDARDVLSGERQTQTLMRSGKASRRD